ncbi:MAG TPA: hypothetical protein VF177_01700 [Anaerolineae bacterium]
MGEIEIRPLHTMDEISQVEEVERLTWDMSDRELISSHTLHALQHNGAALLGAFDDDKLVGFVLGVLGTVDRPDRIDQVAAARLKMYSVIAGVVPDYQNQSVGYQLKLAQRDFALRLGIRLITWTYDPLESLNARFNIGKLGAVCSTYHRNFHGEMSGRNAGLATDRFEVEWWVTSNRVQSRTAQQRAPLSLHALLGGGAVLVNGATFNEAGLPLPPDEYAVQPGNLLLVEIPADFQAIKQMDFSLAKEWRLHTRFIFEELFQAGYVVTDFVHHTETTGQPRSFYLLTHQDT